MAEALTAVERPTSADPGIGLRRIAIVPALNEADTIGAVIAEIRAADPEFEVVVVDDGSTDATLDVARASGAKVLRLPYNLGIGGAVQTGYRYALERGFDLAVQIDGDGQHVPGELPKILGPVVRGECDIAIGSRFAGEGDYKAPKSRRVGMHLFSWVCSLLVGQKLSDTSSSFRAVNRSALAVFAVDYPHGYLETVEATVLAAKCGLRLKEVSVVMRERAVGSSALTTPISLFYSLKVLVALFVGLFRRPLVVPGDGRS
jgi:glycosyltransferase involved in cell wall biosynthesis